MHAILDMVVAQDENATDEINARAIETAWQRLFDADAITAEFREVNGKEACVIEVSPLLSAIGTIVSGVDDAAAFSFPVGWCFAVCPWVSAMGTFATNRGDGGTTSDRLTVINDVRTDLDNRLSDD